MNDLTQHQQERIRERFSGIQEQESMSKHTSFRVGGSADFYLVISDEQELVDAVSWLRMESIPFFIYGGGSNTLVADEGFRGVVVQVALRGIEINEQTVIAQAGAITGMVARQTVERGLATFEWAVGVPGTIGGAVYGNAGCYGGEIKDSLVRVRAIRLSDGVLKEYTNNDCHFGYRESFFKHERHLILSAEFLLPKATDLAASKARLQWVMDERKSKQPLGESSAGCAFKNWDFTSEDQLEILKREIPEIPEGMLKAKRISAGWLIDQADMLGASIGDVAVSEKHGNFMVNKGKAKASDIIALISRVKMKVRDLFGIELEEEVQIVGY